MLPNPTPYFQEIEDPCRKIKIKLHKLSGIVRIVFCAVSSNMED